MLDFIVFLQSLVLFTVSLGLSIIFINVKKLFDELDYIRFAINYLTCYNYMLLNTSNGREMTFEEQFQLAAYQNDLSIASERLGLEDPFPRPIDITTDITTQD